MQINNVARIVRASWNQNNQAVFTSGYAGVQCCAMALANIIRAYIYPPKQWSTNTLDVNMFQGDQIYKEIIMLTANNPNASPISEDGYLDVRNFGVIKEDLIMYDMNFSIEYINNTNIFGNVQDDKNQNGFGITLNEA